MAGCVRFMRVCAGSLFHAGASPFHYFVTTGLFDSVRVAPPDPTGEAVAVRGDNNPWDRGKHPALGKGHNDMSHTLRKHYV